MNEAEAKKIAAICRSADGYCTVCAGELAEQLQEAFPEFEWAQMMDVAEDFEP